MSESEKENYEEVALCKFMSKIMYGICVSLLFCAVGEYVNSQWLFIVGPALMIGLLVFAMIYSNTGNRFKKNRNGARDGSEGISGDR